MASRSEKMYSDSPKVERGENGKHEVKRKAKTAHKPKHDMGEMGGRHAREMQDMHKRHLEEHKAMTMRHEKEAAAAAPQQDDADMPQQGAADQGAM